VSRVIIEVGPIGIRGPKTARPERISTAIETIDDDIALLDERPVTVAQLWRQLMREIVPDHVDTVVVVHPSWWSSSRTALVRDAAQTVAAAVILLRRTDALRAQSRHGVIIECAADLVMVSRDPPATTVVPRSGEVSVDADAVLEAVGSNRGVLVDAPMGYDHLCATVAERLRAKGVHVTCTADDTIRNAVSSREPAVQPSHDVQAPARRRGGVAVVAGVASVALMCGGFALRPAADPPMTLLVEGRLGVMVPAGWRAQRITSGSGSARVQVDSPVDSDVAIHLTQARVGADDLTATAASLRAALEAAPEGVFVDFTAEGRRAGRSAVTYREIREGREVAWTVLNDGGLRIAIGCQSAAKQSQTISEVCDRVIRSAHAIS
jgi:type VII secretion-associated protein (TIGR03931 family)